MALLKEWIYKRRNCFTDEAEQFGIEPPKGIVCVGVPGSGKSLISKAIAGVFGVPVVRLDFGRVFNAYVGRSEERVRKALEMAQAMAPCVLFIDEVEKGLSGTSGGGDSGTSSRVLGTFLTWLQDNTAPVFTVVTANNIANLPPELTRRGRFDAIFASTLPGVRERIEVIKIHLAKRGRPTNYFTAKQYEELAISCKGFVPAEIEAAIKDALVAAYNDGKKLAVSHIKKEMQGLIPLSTSHAEQIAKIIAWAKVNALPTSDDNSEHLESESEEMSTRKRTRLDPVVKKNKLH
jgi:SpoVK/Ycf46/Vps4 family AAA+-type ATPase